MLQFLPSYIFAQFASAGFLYSFIIRLKRIEAEFLCYHANIFVVSLNGIPESVLEH